MNPEIHGLMGRQHGLVTRRQLLQQGVTPMQIKRLVRSCDLTIVRRGVYAETAFVTTQTSMRERRLLLDRAASLRVVMPHVMSHESAAFELGMEIMNPPQPMTHVTRPGVVGSHLVHGVKHHLAPFHADQVVESNGRRVLDRARTALDIAREHGNPAGVVACDDARRHEMSLANLWVAAEPSMRNWPHVAEVREAIELSDAESDSVGETLARLLVTELGFGRPETQFGISADGRTAWCDLRLHRHLIEFDGRAKYQRIDEGGLAISSADEVVWREKQRQDWLISFKLGISRLVWDDLFGRARELALQRLRREYLETCRLFGTSIDTLNDVRARGPRPRLRQRAA